ncbi:carboxypeptidase-like regulatory domain-containing protein [uncultured Tenacibaculum sp.]|uniref:TonB-dependent receptor n=1 Tax=uncultured Tenacibaculum sp. TaxID=174713 RepID=UPI0026345B55|nr:carboxypeptidase-like regulatory domain-containing protein [uncultured Tenacibaculum sp.]
MRFKIRFLFLTLALSVKLLYSQGNDDSSIPLKKVLIAIEKKHEIKFSFSEHLIADKKVSRFSEATALKDQLIDLQNQTGLIFKKITARYFLILEKDEKHTICGYVIDKFSLQPLLGVDVYASNNSVGTTTNEDGYFELSEVQKNNSIIISLLGYKTITTELSESKKSKCGNYFIEEYSAQLSEILINSYLTDGITKSNDGSIVISPQKRGILPGLTEPDVLQSLQLLPDIQSPSETTSGLHVRGGTPDHNLVLFDGIRIYNSAHFFGMISAFNPYVIDKVKVQTNGVGVGYGNHIAGIIDIQTNKRLASKISGGIGSNLTHADAFIRFPLGKKTSLQISGRRSLTDVFNSITFQKISDRVFQNTIIANNRIDDSENFFDKDNKFYFQDFQTKFITELDDNNTISLSQLYINNKLDYRFGSLNQAFIQTDKLSVQNFGISGTWERIWNDDISQETTLYYSNYNLDYTFNGEQTIGVAYRESSIKENSISEYGFKTALNKSFSDVNAIQFGAEYVRNRVDFTLGRSLSLTPNFYYNVTENNISNVIAIFSEFKHQKEERINFSAGLRGSYFSLNKKFLVSPRINFQARIIPKLWLNASYEKKYQNLSQLIEFSTSDFGLENKVWSLSNNEEIPILEADQLSGGLVYKNKGWLLDLNLYMKEVNGLTSLSRGVSTNPDIITSGKSNTKGITALVKKNIGKYTSWVSYSLGETTFTFPFTNEVKSFSGNDDIRHNFIWSHSYNLGRLDFSLGWLYRTGIPFTGVTETTNNGLTEFIAGDVNAERLTPYHRLDFSTTYKFNISKNKRWKGKLGVSFLNLYNRTNKLQKRFYLSNNFGDDTLVSEETISLGFTPNLVFRVTF